MPGTLFVVATPIGNLEDVTFRAVRVLRDASLIAAEDTRRTAALLARHDIRTRTTSFHEHNERRKIPALLARLASGEPVALVSDAGTPSISDPGFRLVRAALDAGIKVEVVPGASAVTTALVASGFPTSSFAFLGFPPPRGEDRRAWMAALAREPRTAVFFEAPHRIRATLEDLKPHVGNRPMAVARELTKVHEEVIRGTALELLGHMTNPRGELTVVVAPATDARREEAEIPSDGDILSMFHQFTKKEGLTRRAAIRSIARTTRMPAKAVYSAVERAKKNQCPS
jgi:16S rRNA (cytidine1402-2'-O)-methyltransferase